MRDRKEEGWGGGGLREPLLNSPWEIETLRQPRVKGGVAKKKGWGGVLKEEGLDNWQGERICPLKEPYWKEER